MVNEIVRDLIDGLINRFERDDETLEQIKKRLEAVEKFVEASKFKLEYNRPVFSEEKTDAFSAFTLSTDNPTQSESFIVRFVGRENGMDYDDGYRHRKIAKSFKTFEAALNFMKNIRTDYIVNESPKLFRVIERELVR